MRTDVGLAEGRGGVLRALRRDRADLCGESLALAADQRRVGIGLECHRPRVARVHGELGIGGGNRVDALGDLGRVGLGQLLVTPESRRGDGDLPG